MDEGRSLLARGLAADGSERLREALALWRGPALVDFAYESFAQAAIARLEEIRLAAIELRIDADLVLEAILISSWRICERLSSGAAPS